MAMLLGTRRRVRFKELVLVSLDWSRPKDPPISLGSASIVSTLHRGGVSAIPLSYNVNHAHFNALEVVEDVFQLRPTKETLLGLGAFVWNEVHVQSILSQLQHYHFPGSILIGGPQISYSIQHPQNFYPDADIYCRGYAENAVLKLMTKATLDDPYPSIGGLTYKDIPDLGVQAACNLEDLPSPYLDGLVPPQSFLRWETQRGCPFRCSFCQHRESHLNTSSGQRARKPFSSNRLLEEAAWFCNNGVTDIAVLDPTFNSGPNYLHVLDMLIDNGYQGKIALQCRFEMVKEEFLQKVTRLISQGSQVVLEFGLQTIIKDEAKAIHRPNNLKKVEQVIFSLHEKGIPFEVSLIFGLPLQTLASFKQSVNFCLRHRVPVVKAWPLMILRGTPLDSSKMRQQFGLKERSICASEEIDRVQIDIPHVVESSTFTEQDWKEMAKVAEHLAQTEFRHPFSV